MKIQLGNGNNKKEHSLGLLHGEAASSAVETAGCSYQSASIIHAGANAQGVALLSALTNLVLSALLTRVPSLVEGKQTSLKRTTIIIAIVSSITWLPLVFVMLFMKNVSPFLLIALWTANLVPTTLVYPLRDNWLAGLIPADKMGRYLSWRSVISGVCFLTTFYMMGVILNITAGFTSRSHAFILAIAFLASAVTIVLYCGVRPLEATKVAEKPTLTFFGFLKDTRKNHLGTFILFVSAYTFTVNLAGPLFASHMLTELNFSYITYTSVVSVEYIARILSLTLWGKLVDKAGSLKILGEVAYIIPFVPILWLFSSNYFYLIGVQLFSGIVWAAFDLSVQTFIYKATSPNQRLRYLVYYRSLTSFSVALGALTGALVLPFMFSIFGSPLLAMFLVSGVLRLVVAAIMLPKLSLKGIPDAVIHPELAAELAAVTDIPRVGLYYYPDLWRRFSRQAVSTGSKVVGRAFSIAGASHDGLFYKPAKWGEYLNKAGIQFNRSEAEETDKYLKNNLFNRPGKWKEYLASTGIEIETQKAKDRGELKSDSLFHKPGKWLEYLSRIGAKQDPVENQTTVQPIRDGLYYHRESWTDLVKDLPSNKTLAGSDQQIECKGLFHNKQRWGEYLKQSFALNATTMRTSGEGMIIRQPIFYYPELWEKYVKEMALKNGTVTAESATRKALLYHPDEWQKHIRRNDKNRKMSPQIGAAILSAKGTSRNQKTQTVSYAPGTIHRINGTKIGASFSIA